MRNPFAYLSPMNRRRFVSDTLLNGLVGWWQFDEGSGTTANDSSGNGNHGTLTNGPSWVAGRVGSGALSFDGVDDYIDAGAFNQTDGASALSISVWVKLDSVANTATGRRWISKWGSDPATEWEFIISQVDGDGADVIVAAFQNLSNYTIQATTGNVLTTGSWLHVVVLWNGGSDIRIYLNGVSQTVVDLSTVGSPAAINATTIPLRIGRDTLGSNGIDGSIDDVRIYNRALTSGEIATLAAM